MKKDIVNVGDLTIPVVTNSKALKKRGDLLLLPPAVRKPRTQLPASKKQRTGA